MRVAEPGPVAAAIRRRIPAAREVTVVVLMGIAGSQVLDENWGAHKVFDYRNPRPVAAAVSYLGLFQGWSMFAPEAPMTDFNLMVDAVTVDGRHVDPYNEIANPRPVLVGETYEGTVVKTTTFGAFVNLVPGRDGLVHISKLGRGKRLSSVEEAVKEGDKLTVLVEDIDPQGKISLKPVGPEWEVPEGAKDDSGGGERRPREDRGGRDRDRGRGRR